MSNNSNPPLDFSITWARVRTIFNNPDPPDKVWQSQFDRFDEKLELDLELESDDIVIVYVGTFTYRGLEKLIDAFKKVASKINNTKLLMIGAGEGESKLHSYAHQMNMSVPRS